MLVVVVVSGLLLGVAGVAGFVVAVTAGRALAGDMLIGDAVAVDLLDQFVEKICFGGAGLHDSEVL